MALLKLVLVRHAHAGKPDPKEFPDDRTRPLTEKGTRRFKQTARGLGRLIQPERVLSSPLARTVQTADLLNWDANWPAPTTDDALDETHSPDDVLDMLRDLPEKPDSVALVGHGPNLRALLADLTGAEADQVPAFDKGGAALVEIGHKLKPGSGHVRWMLDRKALKSYGKG